MLDATSLQSAIDAVLREDRLTEIPPVQTGSAPAEFSAEGRDLLTQGDLVGYHRVRGGRGLVVYGDVRGDAAAPMRVEVRGDILVTGSVQHAVLCGRRVLVGGELKDTQVTAVDTVAATRLEAAGIAVGDYSRERQNIETTRTSLEQARRTWETLARRVIAEEKRLDKACGALRIPLDFNVGRIVQHGEGRVRVDLSSFYGSLEGRTEEQLALALSEFFAKGVVGVITRQNRKYLVNYPSREKVFMQLVRSLRDLFRAVLERDRLQRRTTWLETRVGRMVDDLGTPRGTVEVAGAIAGMATFEFILPRVILQEDGCEFVHQTARLELSGAGGAMSVVSYGADGEHSTSTALPSELDGQRFAVQDGRVVWEAAAETVSA